MLKDGFHMVVYVPIYLPKMEGCCIRRTTRETLHRYGVNQRLATMIDIPSSGLWHVVIVSDINRTLKADRPFVLVADC